MASNCGLLYGNSLQSLPAYYYYYVCSDVCTHNNFGEDFHVIILLCCLPLAGTERTNKKEEQKVIRNDRREIAEKGTCRQWNVIIIENLHPLSAIVNVTID